MKNPNHIAIIMDGNRRWGEKNLNNKLAGHQHGIKNIKKILNTCLKKKISILTIYALSYDNLKNRSQTEIKALFDLIYKFIKKNQDYFLLKKIKLNFIGEKTNLKKPIKKIIIETAKKNDYKKPNITVNIAFNYSSKKEIISSFKKIQKKKLQFSQKNFERNLYTARYSNPEILIRTGGESRLSDFMLWQCAYTEFFFLKKLWPDFSTADLDKVIKKFYSIKRNFGS